MWFRLTGSGSQTQWHNGWTVGAGWEYGITQNWIVGLEYDYAAFERQELSARRRAAGTYTFDAKPRDIQSAVVRLSYKFGGSARREVLSSSIALTKSKPRHARGFFRCGLSERDRRRQPMIE